MSEAYRAPQKPGYLGKYNWRSTVVGIVMLCFSNIIPTQYVASHFEYQKVLGDFLFRVGSIAFYAPWKWAVWVLRFASSSNSAVRQPILYSALFASIGFFVTLTTVALMNMFENKKLLANTEDLHGSARWASEEDLRTTGLLTATQGVYVGGWTDPKTNKLLYLKHDGPEHILAFAPTRSGKGVGLVIPTLLSWPGSVIVYDIKGENWFKTAGFRSATGQLCLKFGPADESGSRWNPLAEIRLGTKREVSDAQNLAEMLCRTGREGPGDEHWITTSVSLITGLLLHVCYVANTGGRVATLNDLSAALTPIKTAVMDPEEEEEDSNPVRDHFEAIKTHVHDPEFKRGWLTAQRTPTDTHPVVAEKLQEMLNREDREFSSVLSTAKKALTLYSDPLVSRNVSYSDIAIQDLVNFDQPLSLYIVVPPSDQERLEPLVRLLFTMVVNRLTEKMEFDGTEQKKNNHRLLLLIDEFPTLGNMKIFSKALAYMAGYGIKAYLITQDVRQVEEAYGKNESIISNCHIRLAYAPNNQETAELLSKMTGTTTMQRAAISFSGARTSPIMNSVTANVEHIQRPLMTPDEVTTLRGPKKEGLGADQKIIEPGAMLIFIAGQHPVLGTQILYFKDEELNRRATFAPPKTFSAILHPNGILEGGVLSEQPEDKPAAAFCAPAAHVTATDYEEHDLDNSLAIADKDEQQKQEHEAEEDDIPATSTTATGSNPRADIEALIAAQTANREEDEEKRQEGQPRPKSHETKSEVNANEL